MILSGLKGYNVSILAYGQTASGKTHTIGGNAENPGLIVLTAKELFNNLNYQKSVEDSKKIQICADFSNENLAQRSTRISISYLEIYNENVNDLLDA